MSASESPPPPAVQLYSVRQAFAADPGTTLARLAAIGFRHVEPWGVLEHRQSLRDGLPAHALTAPAVHAKLIDVDHDAVLDSAAELGIGTVIDPFVPAELWRTTKDVAATAQALNTIAGSAAGRGIRIGYHNHWWELASRIDGRTAFDYFTERLDPAVVLEIDTYWATAGGADAAALLERLGDRVHAVHIKDGGLDRDGHGQVPAGQGDVPIDAILDATPTTALRVVEFDNFDGDIFEALAASYAYLTGSAR